MYINQKTHFQMEANKLLNELKPIPYIENCGEYDFEKRMEMTLMRIAKTLCHEFKIDNDNREIYENSIRYFAGDETGKYNIKKGLFVYGANGVGKSFYFKVFHGLNRAVDSPNNFKMLSVCDLIDGITNTGPKYFTESQISPVGSRSNSDLYWRRPPHILIDDLGQSEETANYYGNNINVVVEFIRRRYYAYIDHYSLTHCSTNLLPSAIGKKYGKYIESRMNEMFNIIFFPGVDKRK